MEIAVPYLNFADDNQDGLPDSLLVYFNVYTAGTTSLLHRTKGRRTSLPTLPCTNPEINTIDANTKVKLLGAASESQVHFVLTQMVGCWDNTEQQWKENFRTMLYSADASTSDSSWIRVWNFDSIGANDADLNNESIKEIMITLSVPLSTGGEKAKIIFINGDDGTTYDDGELYDDSYPLTNNF